MFLCAAGLVLLGPLLLAQAEPPLAFEVASVKPIRDSWLIDIHVQGETVQASGSVQHLVAVAHGAKDYQVFGGPSWIHSTDVMFEIVAKVKAQPEAPNRQQIRSMLQALLAERFQLTLHTEERELPVYMLAIAGGKGLKLTKAASDAKSSFRLAMGPVTKLTGTMSMTNLAFQLALRLHDRPVLDRTASAACTTSASNGPVTTRHLQETTAPGLFTALQEQLGLKLQPAREPSPVFVIDRVDRPSAN